ncbi:uncharacterized protein LOC129229928 [Uloborus diversus]|uniref:uncharacterized protein LOC129229928 n=1 Tax=Uloborus diversus TaxID=327109 RepID=UPI0024095C85|nr:uncharacterized protein LOC129229928 [Uloborus diversus]
MVKWIAISELYQLEFAASYLKLIQFILLCHFHWSLVSRILHQQRLISWVIIPLLAVFFTCMTSVTVMGLASHFSSWNECFAPHWILLSFAEFLGIQLYVVAGIYITKKINSISALDSFKREQKKDLWSVIFTYEFSSVTSVAYYATLLSLGNIEDGCSGIFDHAQEIYSPVYALFMVIKYLLPIWVMLRVFYPTRGCLSSEDERLLGWSGDGSVTSVFSPGTRYQEPYKQMRHPVENVRNNEYSPLRRSASSPAFFAKPALTPISEESSILPASHIQYQGYGATDSFHSQPETSGFSRVSKSRVRHDSGKPLLKGTRKMLKIPVSLNQCSDEIQSVTSSSGERA